MISDNQSDYRDLEGLTKPSLAPLSENQGTDAWRVEKPSFPLVPLSEYEGTDYMEC